MASISNEEKILRLMRQKVYKPLTENELVMVLTENAEEEVPWRELILRLEQSGHIIKTRYNRYGLPEQMNLIVGHLAMQTQGYGFVVPQLKNGQSDIYIPSHALSDAFHQDKVVVRLISKPSGDRKAEGEVIRILERRSETVVGTFSGENGDFGFVKPDEKRLPFAVFIKKGQTMGAQSGEKVVVRITRWPIKRQGPEGEVTEILGDATNPTVAIQAVARQLNLPREFPREALTESERVQSEVDVEESARRRDLRRSNIVTIDGEDAKDLDDAVEVELGASGSYRLGVHIADVAHYVPENSALDKEAYLRGTSIYLVNQVIPMLPPALSNGICSLNPRVDRLALSIVMEIDQQGQVVSHDLFESVIKTRERFTYGEVNELLAGENEALRARYADQLEHVRLMAKLRDLLRSKREKRGSIDFELSEAKIILDAKGHVVDIAPRARTLSDSIIEEFMLAANETIAARFYAMQVPFVYRVHEEPKEEKVQDLNLLLNNFGLRLKTPRGKIHPNAYRQVMASIEGRPEAHLINRVLLRSMMRARYSPECAGHFGLAAKFYSHFTSPIRRYPDLLIHRIIKEVLREGQISPRRWRILTEVVGSAARQSSEREQLATEAERTIDDMKKAEYMAGKIGETFTGIISGVVSFGFFVELPNTVEGLVHVSNLHDDYYIFDAEAYTLIGRRLKKRYRMGDSVHIKVEKVNVEEATIDFSLLEP